MTVWPDVQAPSGYRPGHAPVPHVVNQVAALRNLPHMTILRVQTGAAAQIVNDGDAHYLSYAGTDEVDYLDPETLKWDRKTFDTLTRMLPAIILDQP